MKAPDKIYISHAIYDTWQFTIPDPNDKTEVEYIRKDALLEWAKEQKKDCERVIREHPEDESLWCERDKYDELIDKIESI